MEPGDTSDNYSQLSPSQCHNDDDDDDNTDNGNEYNWTSQTIAIAVPSLAGMMTDPLLSLADTLFVGMLGSTVAMNVIGNVGRGSVAVGTTSPTVSSGGGSSVPLAALGACTSIFHLCFHCFRATTSSTSSLVAAALVRDEQQSKKTKGDAHDVECDSIIQEQQPHQQNEAVLIAQTSIQQSIIMGAFITTFLLVFGPQCLLAMGVSPHNGQAQLYPSAMTYLNNRSIAAPAVVMLSASEGIFRGYGDVITPWKVSCLVSLLNLILDPYCMFGGGRGVMYGLGMGIKGAAVATALSQVIGALVYGRKLFQRRMLGGNIPIGKAEQGDLKRQKRSIAATILRANAAMMAKQGSLLLAWAYATSRATRMGHTIVASHQMALSIWLVVALFLDGAGVAAQVLMAREWEGYKLSRTMDGSDESSTQSTTTGGKRRAIKSLSLYMIKLSLIQGLVGSLAILLLRQSAPSFIFTSDPAVRQNLFTLLPHVAYQMTLVSATLVTEALAIGGGRFKWLAGGTTVSAVIAMVELRGAKDLVGIWSGVS
jgi:MATE family multidrug resistance protein